jgi:hypothetical protein
MSEHIPIERAWILIQETSTLSTKEAEHLEKCCDCGEFLQNFLSVVTSAFQSLSQLGTRLIATMPHKRGMQDGLMHTSHLYSANAK